MLPSDLDLCRLCAASYTDTSVFDYVDAGAQRGVCAMIKHLDGYDVVVGRGSDDIGDWENDGDATMVTDACIPGRVSRGFLRGVSVAANNIKSYLRGLPVVFTAHSLGCPHVLLISKFLPITSARFVLFESPRPGDETFRDSFKGISLTAYRNTVKDPIPYLPLYVPPEFDYFDISISPVWIDGLADNKWVDVMKYHHIQSVLKGLENAAISTNS